MATRKRDDDLVFTKAAAIVVGGSSHTVAAPRPACDEPVREFGAMTDDLSAIADWLLACGVDTVELESTGVYWMPVFEALTQRGLRVLLVDARQIRQIKYVSGRKSEVQFCRWLQRLMSQGYLRAAFRLDADLCACVVRAVARQCDTWVADQASWVQRMQKALVQMNIQLTEVLSDAMGTTRPTIILAIVVGERDPKVLAPHRNGRFKASEQDIAKALTGRWRDEHLLVLRQALAMCDDIGRHRGECDARLQGLLTQLGQSKVDLAKAPHAGSQTRAEFDTRQILASWAGVDLTRINGLGLAAVMKILSEVGPDLSRLASISEGSGHGWLHASNLLHEQWAGNLLPVWQSSPMSDRRADRCRRAGLPMPMAAWTRKATLPTR